MKKNINVQQKFVERLLLTVSAICFATPILAYGLIFSAGWFFDFQDSSRAIIPLIYFFVSGLLLIGAVAMCSLAKIRLTGNGWQFF